MDSGEYVGKGDFTLSDNQSDSEDGDSESVGSEDEMPISEDHEEVTMTFDDCSSSCDEGDVQNYLNADNAIPTGTEAPSKGNQPNLQNPEHKKSVRFLKHMTHFILDAFSRAKYVSLLNDYVESEFFLIDGDSLFITCVTETTLCQGQHLHFFYFVERFLLDLTEKGAKYVIVFFKDAENLYFKDPSLLSLRAALILHLRHNTDTTVHTEFSNCLSPDWQIFLKESYPYFILVSDEGLNLAQTHFFYILIIHSLGKKINVVLTSGQESDVIRVYGYHLQSKYSHRSFFEKFLENIQHSCRTLVQFLQESYPKALFFQHGYLTLKDIQKEVHQTMSLLKKQWPEESDVRRILCAVTCSVILNLDTATLSSAQAVPENCSQEESNEPLTQQEVADLCRMHCLSVTLLLHLPLSQRTRARNLDYSWNKEADGFLKMQRMCLYYVLKQLDSSADWEVDLTRLPDFNDNLLWQNIVHYYERDNVTDLKLGEDIEKGYHYLWNIVSKLSNKCDAGEAFPVRSTSKPFLGKTKKAVEETHKKIPSVGLIPMRSTLVEEFAGDVLKDMPLLSSDDTAVSSLVRGKDFDELVHWHSGNPLSDDYDRTQENFNAMSKDPKALRQRQKLHQYNMMYGRSLEGDIFKTIVTQGDVPSNAKSTVKYKKTTISHKTKAQKIIEENQKSKKVKVDQQQFERWSQLSPSVMREIKENIASGTSHLDEFLKTCQSDTVKFTAELSGLDACLEVWIEHCKCQDSHSRDTTIAVHVMRRVHSLLWKYKQALEKKNLDKITKCLNCFGFYNLACSLDSKQITERDKDKVSKYALEMGAARFQLQYMGHYLFRDERRDPDPRVQHFIPDTWQRELLDVVDSNESAVIVAPTSSGKTYASYYCMEKILKEGNDGIVVYVAPTKALVNQVVATVCNRFRKALPDGLTVCGVFTRDYRTDALNCQILVTVPQCLEILLLAPHRQNWVKRIKYVIFDEVHCLGGEIGAEVWEHLLVMIRCPFLALSATISNPEHLTEWMESVKRYWQECDSTRESTESSRCTKKAAKKHKEVTPDKKSYKVRLVLHGERYNDLEKHVCSVQQGKILLDHFHPCASLTVNHIERYGFPSDLSFSPRESVQLYDTMFENWPQWPKAQELDPERFTCFKDKAVITKADARTYEEELKKELKNWIVIGHKEKVNQLLLSLKPHPTDCSENVMEKQFPLFIEKLREMDKLPAIIFLFNVKEVEAKAISVFCYLKQKQRASQTPNTEKEKHNLMEKLNKLEKSIKKTQTLDNKLPSASKADGLVMACEEQRSLQKRLDKITEIPQDCTHANNKALDEMTLEKMMKTLWTVRNRGLLKMLAQRGIGFHYDPLQAKGRQFVEMLFRMGFMRVITSTSSLALGINMPCKSVVFAADSVELDALNYRQMSGRAGRRGQDLIGNVYFYDIPIPKVEKLMKSNVPQLKGQFPLSISLVLRLMFLASKADDKEDAKAKVVSVLKHSLLSFKRAKTQEMLQLYFIFSVQFLIQEGYLDQDGNPSGFAGLVSHLHYHEPANFVLVSFLVKGLFHKLCQPIAKGSTVFSEHVMETLVLILANLFGRMPFAACFAKQKDTFEQSKVFLEDLPEDFAAAVHEYNSKIETLFGCFLRTASKQADKEQENKLPLSKISFAGKQCEDSELVSYLMNCTKERTAVSPFACLSGMVDLDLFDAKRVASAVMRTIDVKARDVPVLHLKKYDNQGRRMPLNAYALDFYKHGSLHAMTEDNRLNEGDAYQLLKDFMLMVQSIRTSLGELCENKNDNVLLAFEQLSESYCSKLKKY